MAQTYTHTPVLSKVKLGNTTYYLKDADVRSILDTFGNSVTYNVAPAIADNGTGLVTADLVYDFVNHQIGAVGDILNLLSTTDHTTVETPTAGDFVVESDGSEWLYDGTVWRVIGSENAYVLKTTTIAGVDLQDNITKAELQSALELHALAYKDNGTVTITTADSYNSFTTGAAGTYSVSSTSVSVPATYDALDVTPAGSVTITAGTSAAASYDKTTGVTIGSAAAGQDGTPNYTPAGSVTVDSVTVTPSTGTAAVVTSSGTAYTLATSGEVTQGTDTTSAFTTEGVVCSIGTGDDAETLIITNATTSNAVTASGTVSYTAPTLSGAMPTFDTIGVVTGITSASAQASFSGDGAIISATPTYTSAEATMTQPTFTGSFSGTSKSVTPTVATSVNAAGTDGEVTVTSETITPTAVSTEKTINVAFGVSS